MNKIIITVITALIVTSAPAFATTPASSEECDPETDLWNCDCPEELEAASCEIIAYSELPAFDDLSQVDTSSWIHTVYDDENDLYRVTADLDAMPGQGIFKALERNGQWESETELYQYLSTLLGVPYNQQTERLKEFEYTQTGQSRKYMLLNGFLVSSGTFYMDLVTGSLGALYVDGELVTQLASQCTPGMYNDICDADGAGAPCRSEVPLADGKMSGLSVNEVHTWVGSSGIGLGCAKNFLGELRWDMSLYVVENATQEQAVNTEPLLCEINSWPYEVQCNIEATEELTASETIVDPNDPEEVELKRRFRIVRTRGKMITEGEYFANDNPINRNRVSVNEAFSIEVEYGRQLLNGMCTTNAVALGFNMDMAENGTAHQSVSPPDCLP